MVRQHRGSPTAGQAELRQPLTGNGAAGKARSALCSMGLVCSSLRHLHGHLPVPLSPHKAQAKAETRPETQLTRSEFPVCNS